MRYKFYILLLLSNNLVLYSPWGDGLHSKVLNIEPSSAISSTLFKLRHVLCVEFIMEKAGTWNYFYSLVLHLIKPRLLLQSTQLNLESCTWFWFLVAPLKSEFGIDKALTLLCIISSWRLQDFVCGLSQMKTLNWRAEESANNEFFFSFYIIRFGPMRTQVLSLILISVYVRSNLLCF